jgi:CubicO group peptidase (beta-lactamase class C family)
MSPARSKPAEMTLDTARLQRARDLMQAQVESGRSPGLVAVVARRGEIVLAESFGVRNSAGDRMEVDSVFPIASGTKPITAAVVMTLAEDGEIGLNQRVVDYLPELPESLHGVLVHHLLTHTSGFEAPTWTGRFRTRMLDHGDADAEWGRDRIVNAYLGCIPDLAKVTEPGAGMLYANLGYEMLGEIVRRLTGQRLGEVMEARIFQPLGMHDTSMVVDDSLRGRMIEWWEGLPMASMTEAIFGAGLEVLLDSDSASGGLVSTAADNVRFSRMILGGGALDGVRVLSDASVRAMTINQIPGIPDVLFGHKEASWGYGFSVICEERWPYFGGGLVPHGSVTHNGAGGVDHWIDFEHEIAGAFFELITEMSPELEPVSGAGHRFQDVITAAVRD